MKIGTDAMVLGAIVPVANNENVLDIGAGTGVLSLILAQKAENLNITAIEIDSEALQDLKTNFVNAPFQSKFEIIPSDVRMHTFNRVFDCIISNPPFFKNSFTNGQKDARSLARNEDNLTFIQLVEVISKNLSISGTAWLIFPFDSCEEIEQLLKEKNLYLSTKWVINGKPNVPVRAIYGLRKVQVESILNHVLTIRNSDGSYTDDYIELTKDFHSKDLRKK